MHETSSHAECKYVFLERRSEDDHRRCTTCLLKALLQCVKKEEKEKEGEEKRIYILGRVWEQDWARRGLSFVSQHCGSGDEAASTDTSRP
jgi:hypothetical protein